MLKATIVFIEVIHMSLMILNLASLPAVIAFCPWYLWAPIVTLLVSPHIGGTHCFMNNLSNSLRKKVGWPVILQVSDYIFWYKLKKIKKKLG